MVPRAQQFDEMVLDALGSVERRLGRTLDGLQVAVEDVPPSDPAEGSLPTKVVLYRRPLETRAGDPGELAAMVHEVLVEQVAAMLGIDPEELL
jgi:predicted Zn-dependent protease with MMP-like domain